MQTKKRAKPVKFGKAAAADRAKKEKPAVAAPKATVTVKEEIREKVVEVTSSEPPKETKKLHVESHKEEIPEEDIDERIIQETELDDEVEEEPPTPLRSRIAAEEEPETTNVVQEAEDILSSAAEADAKPREAVEETSESESEPTPEKNDTVVEEEAEFEEEEPVIRRRVTSEDSPFSDEPVVTTEKKKNLFVYFVVVALITFFLGLAFIVGGSFALQNKDISLPEFTQLLGMSEEEPTPEPTTKLEPTATPEPVDLSKYTIQVLNGSGVTGEAAKLKTALIDAGFKVGSTGNADLSDYTKTQISASKSVDKAYLKKLEETLEKTYVLDSSAPSTGSTPQGADVVITIGSDKAE